MKHVPIKFCFTRSCVITTSMLSQSHVNSSDMQRNVRFSNKLVTHEAMISSPFVKYRTYSSQNRRLNPHYRIWVA